MSNLSFTMIYQIKSGEIFIYPTDTIYGIGCDATNIEAVEKIKKIKGRDRDKPLSVIAPSLGWIKENLIVDVRLEKYLPGPYTLILKKKDKNFLNHISSGDSLGVRIPDTELTKEIQASGVPFVTTSVNLSGEPFMTSLNDLNSEIKNKVDEVIDAGELSGRPSTLIIDGKELKR